MNKVELLQEQFKLKDEIIEDYKKVIRLYKEAAHDLLKQNKTLLTPTITTGKISNPDWGIVSGTEGMGV